MTDATHVYEDQWGAIIDRPGAGYLEIRWYDTTKNMTGDEFNAWLSTFAEKMIAAGRAGALVDSVQFKMPHDRMSMGWRDENIIPKYNRSGLKRFAFLMPEGMPAIGRDPAPEGPAEFPTCYFRTRAHAIAWLADS